MAERNFDFVETLGRKKRLIAGSFVPNGAGAIDNSLNTGVGFTVAKNAAAGVYDVTFRDGFNAVQSAEAHLVQAAVSQHVQVSAVDPSARTMTIRGSDHGAWVDKDIAAAAGTRIHFTVLFDDALTA